MENTPKIRAFAGARVPSPPPSRADSTTGSEAEDSLSLSPASSSAMTSLPYTPHLPVPEYPGDGLGAPAPREYGVWTTFFEVLTAEPLDRRALALEASSHAARLEAAAPALEQPHPEEQTLSDRLRHLAHEAIPRWPVSVVQALAVRILRMHGEHDIGLAVAQTLVTRCHANPAWRDLAEAVRAEGGGVLGAVRGPLERCVRAVHALTHEQRWVAADPDEEESDNEGTCPWVRIRETGERVEALTAHLDDPYPTAGSIRRSVWTLLAHIQRPDLIRWLADSSPISAAALTVERQGRIAQCLRDRPLHEIRPTQEAILHVVRIRESYQESLIADPIAELFHAELWPGLLRNILRPATRREQMAPLISALKQLHQRLTRAGHTADDPAPFLTPVRVVEALLDDAGYLAAGETSRAEAIGTVLRLLARTGNIDVLKSVFDGSSTRATGATLETWQTLCSEGLETSSTVTGDAAVHAAVDGPAPNRGAILQCLLTAGPGPRYANRAGAGGETPLHRVVDLPDGGARLIPMLIAAGADPSQGCAEPQTPLEKLCVGRHPEGVDAGMLDLSPDRERSDFLLISSPRTMANLLPRHIGCERASFLLRASRMARREPSALDWDGHPQQVALQAATAGLRTARRTCCLPAPNHRMEALESGTTLSTAWVNTMERRETLRGGEVPGTRGWIQAFAEAASETRQGDCFGMAAVAHTAIRAHLDARRARLAEASPGAPRPEPLRVEMVFMGFGGRLHRLVLIGREGRSAGGNAEDWGPKAVLCDPFHNWVFLARDWDQHTGAAYPHEPYWVAPL